MGRRAPIRRARDTIGIVTRTGGPRLAPLACVLSCILSCTLSCATVPRVPEAPTPEEQPLVDHAHAWCAAAGYPAGVPPRSFTTDSCTGWIDGDLHECCVEHDVAYWCGGSVEGRLEADRSFRACAEERTPGQSGLVYYSVRMWGVPWLPTSWRWGYGHPFGTGYVEPQPGQQGEPGEEPLLGSPE
jgi:hypothetical protein